MIKVCHLSTSAHAHGAQQFIDRYVPCVHMENSTMWRDALPIDNSSLKTYIQIHLLCCFFYSDQ